MGAAPAEAGAVETGDGAAGAAVATPARPGPAATRPTATAVPSTSLFTVTPRKEEGERRRARTPVAGESGPVVPPRSGERQNVGRVERVAVHRLALVDVLAVVLDVVGDVQVEDVLDVVAARDRGLRLGVDRDGRVHGGEDARRTQRRVGSARGLG